MKTPLISLLFLAAATVLNGADAPGSQSPVQAVPTLLPPTSYRLSGSSLDTTVQAYFGGTNGGIPPNSIPPQALQALQSAITGTLYSLDPGMMAGAPGDKAFHNHHVLGQAELDLKQMVTASSAFQSAVANWNPSMGMALCFNPRHGLRVTANGHVFDFVLCYECGQLYIYEDDKNIASLGAIGTPDILNNLLSTAKVPLPAPAQSEESNAAEQKLNDENRTRWVAAMPKSLQQFWSPASWQQPSVNVTPLRAPLAEEFPDPSQRILALLGWYGSGAGQWNGFPSYEIAPDQLLLDFTTVDIVAAINKGPLTDAQTEGAARFFAGGNFARQRDLKTLPPEIKKLLLEHSLKSTDADKLRRAQKAFGE